MKKIIIIFALVTGINHFSQAQMQREHQHHTDSTSMDSNDEEKKFDKHAVVSELNLSEDQKAQIKDLKDSFKEQKESISNDINLTDIEKQEKLKKLKKDQLINFQSILTKEQKEKLKQMRKKNKSHRNRSKNSLD